MVVTPLTADLTSAADLERVGAKIREDAGISLLVNCAGIGPNGPLLGSDPSDLSKMVQLNVDVLHSLTATAANAFARRRNGTIINIASVVALMPERFNATYVATKAFVLALTQALSQNSSRMASGCKRCFRASRAPDIRQGRHRHQNDPHRNDDGSG